MRRLLSTAIVLWAGCPHPALAAPSQANPAVPPVWVGEMASSHRLCFALEGARGEGAPRWLGLGDSCDGYVLVRYESHPETLTLRRGAETVVLTLANGSVAPTARTDASEPPAPANARGIAAAEVRTRDGWDSATTCEPAQRHGGQWWVLVKHTGAARNEARMVILSDDGRVLDYWRV